MNLINFDSMGLGFALALVAILAIIVIIAAVVIVVAVSSAIVLAVLLNKKAKMNREEDERKAAEEAAAAQPSAQQTFAEQAYAQQVPVAEPVQPQAPAVQAEAAPESEAYYVNTHYQVDDDDNYLIQCALDEDQNQMKCDKYKNANAAVGMEYYVHGAPTGFDYAVIAVNITEVVDAQTPPSSSGRKKRTLMAVVRDEAEAIETDVVTDDLEDESEDHVKVSSVNNPELLDNYGEVFVIPEEEEEEEEEKKVDEKAAVNINTINKEDLIYIRGDPDPDNEPGTEPAITNYVATITFIDHIKVNDIFLNASPTTDNNLIQCYQEGQENNTEKCATFKGTGAENAPAYYVNGDGAATGKLLIVCTDGCNYATDTTIAPSKNDVYLNGNLLDDTKNQKGETNQLIICSETEGVLSCSTKVSTITQENQERAEYYINAGEITTNPLIKCQLETGKSTATCSSSNAAIQAADDGEKKIYLNGNFKIEDNGRTDEEMRLIKCAPSPEYCELALGIPEFGKTDYYVNSGTILGNKLKDTLIKCTNDLCEIEDLSIDLTSGEVFFINKNYKEETGSTNYLIKCSTETGKEGCSNYKASPDPTAPTIDHYVHGAPIGDNELGKAIIYCNITLTTTNERKPIKEEILKGDEIFFRREGRLQGGQRQWRGRKKKQSWGRTCRRSGQHQ